MTIAESILPEFDHEMASTRKCLERIPDDKRDWKAHPKSNTIGWVGGHLAEIPGWVVGTMTETEWDYSPPGQPTTVTPSHMTRDEILQDFDKHVAEGRAAIAAAKDEDFFVPWTLLYQGNVVFTMPRIAVLRSFVLNHSIHHRAHLCVYLWLNDIPVPGLYGPSADD